LAESKRIGREFGYSQDTLSVMWRWAGLSATGSRWPRTLDGLEEWLKERFRRHEAMPM
jgi:hypothetical protein